MSGLDELNTDGAILPRLADAYGFILLGVTAHNGDWDGVDDAHPDSVDVRKIDAALRYVLQHYAIDPTRLALMGESAGAGETIDLGYENGDVFSRLIAVSGWDPFSVKHEFDHIAPHGTPEIWLSFGANEGRHMQMPAFAAWLGRAGYAVTYAEDQGQHGLDSARAVTAFTWLAHSWQASPPRRAPAPPNRRLAVAIPPLLTEAMVTPYAAVEPVLAAYWAAHPAARDSVFTHMQAKFMYMTPLPHGGRLESIIMSQSPDYAVVVQHNQAVAAIFTQHHFAPAQFAPTDLAVRYAILAALTKIPIDTTTYGQNIIFVQAHRVAIATAWHEEETALQQRRQERQQAIQAAMQQLQDTSSDAYKQLQKLKPPQRP